MRTRRRFNHHGFTLLELMAVVAILGVLAVLAIYGVRRMIAASKTAEAKNTVGSIARAAVAAYERESYNNQLLAGGASSNSVHSLCASADARVPPAAPIGTRYQPSMADGVDFNTGSNTAGWKCLAFSLSQPTYYAYHYVTGAGSGLSGATASGFEVSALGDLNGNAGGATAPGPNASFFARGADVRKETVVLSTEVYVENEYE